MTLPLVINPGDVGHISHHKQTHELLSRLDGQTDFLATGVFQDVLVNLPPAGPSLKGLLRFAEDLPALAYCDGSSWRTAVLTTTTNQFTAPQEYADDVFFGSGRPWVDPMHSDYGAVGDGVNVDEQAVLDAIDVASPAKAVVYFQPGHSFLGVDANWVDFKTCSGVMARGATFLTMHVMVGPDCTWDGGLLDEGAGTTANAMMRIYGDRARVLGVRTAALGFSYSGLEVRTLTGVDRPEHVYIGGGFDIEARSGITVYASFGTIVANGRVHSNGDDGVVLKDVDGQGCEVFSMSNVIADGVSSIIGLGRDAGNRTLTVGPANGFGQGGIRNVTVSNCVSLNCGALVLVKPGTAGVNEHSLVENVTVSNCFGYDPLGTAMSKPVNINAAAGAAVKRIRVLGVHWHGRMKDTASNPNFIFMTVTTSATIADVKVVASSFTDLYGGVDHDAPHPGYPASRGANIEKTDGTGSITQIMLEDVYLNGMTNDGISAGCDDALKVIRPVIKNFRQGTGVGAAQAFFLETGAGAIIEAPDIDRSVANWIRGSMADLARWDSAKGVGSPNGVLNGLMGSDYKNLSGGAGTTLFVKETAVVKAWAGK